ncbi:MAG: hypothetical protein QF486_06960 [Candidatus Woesearchaeota archaeon]|nr:hypothetical protein [Candidatus Woesearchaeota archaeon]MDP7199323.1 hypothetical protein [Candidatus Woesearchaeota archaeon]MDP7467870.1 hypothetical protein [Candidatus Woesearchaeota archaeon]
MIQRTALLCLGIMVLVVSFMAIDMVLASGYDPAMPIKEAMWNKVCQ